MNRLLDVDEMIGIVGFTVGGDFKLCEAQDAKTLRAVGRWLEGKFVTIPLRGGEWHIRLDEVDLLKQGRMSE